MRVAIIHNFYDKRNPSGENSVVLNDVEQMRNLGHEVDLYGFGIDDFRLGENNPLKVISGALQVLRFRAATKKSLEIYKPDIVHFHNLFPFVGFGVLKRAQKINIPTVFSMHNYRITCLNGMHFRNSQICTKCISSTPTRGIFFGCFRGSKTQSFFAYLANLKLRSIIKRVDGVVTLSPFMTSHIKVFMKKDCQVLERPTPSSRSRSKDFKKMRRVVYAGRLSQEKGIYKLCEDWCDSVAAKTGWTLFVLGDGPQMRELSQRFSDNASIRFLGLVSVDQVSQVMKESMLVIIPSRWFEGFPKIISQAAEASCALAVTDIGSLGSLEVPGLLKISDKPKSWQKYFNQLEAGELKSQGDLNLEWWKGNADSGKAANQLVEFYTRIVR